MKTANPTKKRKRPGRKPATDAERAAWRNGWVHVRVNDAEAMTISGAAKLAGMSVAAFVRRAALEAAR